MIGPSIDTNKFSKIPFDERFRAEPPQNASLLLTDAVDIVVSGESTDIQTSGVPLRENSRSVEQTLDEIVRRCRIAVEKYPLSSRSHLNLGLALMRLGSSEEGTAELELAVSLNDPDYVAIGSLAAAYFNTGRMDDAEKCYWKMIEISDESAAGYLGLASIALRRDMFEQAGRYLEKALDRDPHFANASFLLAVVHFKLGNPKKAISVFRKALSDNARSPELHQGLAIAYLLSGEVSRAERSFHTALALAPKLASAVQGLSLLLLNQKRSDEAIEILSRYLEGEAGSIELRETLSQALIDRGMFRQARMHLAIVLTALCSATHRNSDEIAKIQNNIGYCLIREGSYKDAINALAASIEESPRLGPKAFENLSGIYYSQGDYERAVKLIDQGLAFGNKSQTLILLKEVCLVDQGLYEEAISEMLRLVAEPGALPEVYAELGWLLCEWREDFRTATAILQAALEKWPGNSLILNNLAYAHIMQGELVAARALLDVVGKESGNQVFVQATRGLLAIREGNIEEGDRLYRDAESLAARQGNREIVLALRQKRDLEAARAYLRLGDTSRALKFVEHGRAVATPPRWATVRRQLADVERTIMSGIGAGDADSIPT